MMIRANTILLLALAILLAGTPAFGADGDSCEANSQGTSTACGANVGTDASGLIVVLCDSKTSAGDCNSGAGIRIDPKRAGGRTTLAIRTAAACTAVSVTFTWSDMLTGGVEHALPSASLDLTTTAVTFARGQGPPGGWIFPTVATATDCTDLDVVMHLE